MQALKSLVAHLGKGITSTHDLASTEHGPHPSGGSAGGGTGTASKNPQRYRSQSARANASRAALCVPSLREHVASG